MARLGVSKKKKSPRATELSQLKKEVQRLTEQLESYKRELAEATERETATGEILRVIASSLTDLQSVLDTVAENAARLCDSSDAQLRLIDGNILRLVASYGSLPTPEIKTITRQNVTGRAIIDRQMIHVHDLETERETEYPDSERAAGVGQSLRYRCYAMALLLELFSFVAWKFGLSQTNRFHFSKLSPTKRLLPSKTCDCSKS
jgi:hypothetical protein